jgi:crotonobetainyl-CoA:carnitine CoA-transferase CaiB-like acyl-CoA transferase
VAAARLRDLGASVLKLEPPTGDPLGHLGSGWYEALCENMEVVIRDLKSEAGLAALHDDLARADLLLTASRPAGLARLGLDWETLHARHPNLCHVAIVGYPPPDENVPGHDLTYQAEFNMLTPPHLPRVLVADLAGAERAVSDALALIFARERGQGAGKRTVALADAAREFALPAHYNITTPGNVLGGGIPNYRIYPTREGYLAVAALEPHFCAHLMEALELDTVSEEVFAERFLTRTAREWEDWASERDLPLAAIRSDDSPNE